MTAEARAAEGLRPTVTVPSSHVESLSKPQPSAQAEIAQTLAEQPQEPASGAATVDAARREQDERRQQVQSEIVARVLAEQRRATSPKPSARVYEQHRSEGRDASRRVSDRILPS